MKTGSISLWSFSSFLFFGFFLLIGLLNVWYVSVLFGVLYMLFALVYLPGFDTAVSRILHLNVPRGLKYLVALLVLWGTLAVGDLMELFETWMLHS
ncbi:hypothetical protein [Winogradskyella aurantiaca]|uniref:hypothetical protein n=1 Tax=Winogradskyella aurantiaca TaxID=2219558 RepID=UPI000E1D1DA3|nr:hypothetical protein [Winogradskyella aurantiaca]